MATANRVFSLLVASRLSSADLLPSSFRQASAPSVVGAEEELALFLEEACAVEDDSLPVELVPDEPAPDARLQDDC
jgi:hypothetical protein